MEDKLLMPETKKDNQKDAKKARKKDIYDPWVNARMEWNAHEGYVVASKRRWQIVGLMFGFLALSAIAGVIYIGSQSKFIPYVVAVDKLGSAVAVSRADVMAPVDKRVIMATLANFIHDLRFVTPDIAVQKRAIFNIYSYFNQTDPATKKTNEHFEKEATNPFKRAESETVNVNITSVVQQSQESWQVYWTEEIRDRKGKIKEKPSFRANINIYIMPATATRTEADIQQNPLGIIISDYFIGSQL